MKNDMQKNKFALLTTMHAMKPGIRLNRKKLPQNQTEILKRINKVQESIDINKIEYSTR